MSTFENNDLFLLKDDLGLLETGFDNICCNGPDYICHKHRRWAKHNGIEVFDIQSGKLLKNAYIERFKRTVRYDFLKQDIVELIEEIKEKVKT